LTIPKLSRGKQIALDFFLVFLFAALLIKPYFKAKYTDKWASIESTFIADARFLTEHWPHPKWQPLWYGGTRFDYIYPPALRYGTAGLSKLFGWWPVKAYHFYVAFFYALGIAGVYLLVRIGSGSRGAAWLGAVATATMSPIFLLLPRYRADAWMLQPQRLGVLVKYGEGPHMTALALIPITLAFAWIAFERRRWWAAGLAGVFAAGVASNNFYGATALAVFYPLLVWAFWITRQDKSILAPALAIPAIAYGLTAFWLVPSYFAVTAANMKYVSEHGTTWSVWVALAVAVTFAVTTDKLAKGRPARTWGVFVAGAVVFFSVNVLGNIWFNFRVSGEPTRLLPELDMIYIMAALIPLRWMWNRGDLAWRAAAGLLVAAAFATTVGYFRHAWHMFPLWPDYQSRIEYRMNEWLWKNMPDARLYPSGSVRFWFNAWHDMAQVGGGSEQGLLNGMVIPAQWETNLGKAARPAILWMQAMGADAIYVSDQRSEEEYKDFLHPQKFVGALPVLYDDGKGNVLYRVPRRFAPRARVVETAKLDGAKPPRFNDDVAYLQAYVDVVEKGPEAPAALERRGTDAMVVRARVAPGQSVLVQESFDTAWRARSEGRELRVRKDVMGMMVIEAPAGEREIELEFVTPLENRVGRVVTGMTVLGLIGMVWVGRRRRG
jgi:hypothetical protein